MIPKSFRYRYITVWILSNVVWFNEKDSIKQGRGKEIKYKKKPLIFLFFYKKKMIDITKMSIENMKPKKIYLL